MAHFEGRQIQIPMSQTFEGPLFALDPLVRLLGGRLSPGPGGAGFVLQAGEVEAVIGPASRVMTVGREIVQLSQAPALRTPGEGGLHAPLDLIRRTLGVGLDVDFHWEPQQRSLAIQPRQRQHLEVGWNLVHLQGLSTLALQFSERPRYQVRERGRLIEIEILGDRLSPRVERDPVSDPLIRGLHFGEDRILLELEPGTVAESYEQTRPFRLVFDVYRRQVAAEPQEPDEAPEPAVARGGLRTIVLDPGHGGGETGAIGPRGTEEKELALSISRLLKRRLEARLPVRVVLTRDEDADLPLDTRAAIANQHQADLFISVHLNSSVGPTAHGAETYFLSLEASDARAAAAARAENRSPALGEEDQALSDLRLILWDMAQAQYLAESQRFATLVQDELNVALGLRDRGVKQAPFRVLMGAAMPAVLVELGFLSNPREEERLLQPAYQAELVEALVRAVVRYKSQLTDGGERAER
jgi:N-acetylmuramoyl-L-alanine amidase